MQIFEFLFNPKNKEDAVFNCFSCDPQNIYEKRVGSLYMVGLLKNTLPQNAYFINNLARTIKEKYYKNISSSQEKSLRETLRRANEYLEKIAKAGDVSWLGNLNFAVLSLKNLELNFTKVGELKMFLVRKGKIIDIDQKLKFEEIEPYPLKIFGSIISGKMNENDIILALTKEIFNAFLKENILNEVARISLISPLDQGLKKIKNIFESKKEGLSKISGACLIIALTKEPFPKEKEIISPKKKLVVFTLKDLLSFVPFSLFPSFSFHKNLPVFKKLKFPKMPTAMPKIAAIPPIANALNVKKLEEKILEIKKNKNLSLIIFLLLILLSGSLIFKKQEEREIKEYQIKLEQIRENIDQGKNLLILSENNSRFKQEANSIFLQNWRELSAILDAKLSFPDDFTEKASGLKNEIFQNLKEVNCLEIIEPETFFEFQLKDFVPQKLIAFSNNVYFYTPYAQNIVELNQAKETKIYQTEDKFNLANVNENSLLFFSKPNKLTVLSNGSIRETVSLQLPYPDSNFSQLSSFQSNLYFWDKNNQKIIKYSKSGNQWISPRSWLSQEFDLESLAVDGSVWVLTEANKIKKYYGGELQKTLNLNIFPEPKYFSKIFASAKLPYIYLLDPGQKRLVVINKNGEIISQYQSEKFDNLLDFSLTEDGRTLFILNGLKVFKINI